MGSNRCPSPDCVSPLRLKFFFSYACCVHACGGLGFDAAWQANIADEKSQSQEMFGLLLIGVHVLMVAAVVCQGWMTMQVRARSLCTTTTTRSAVSRVFAGSKKKKKSPPIVVMIVMLTLAIVIILLIGGSN